VIHNLRTRSLTPGGWYYRTVFLGARLAARFGLNKPNTRIHYVDRDDWILVLTPLAGSSSIRQCVGDVRTFDLRRPPLFDGKRVFVMCRPHIDRMTSFYNKKVRNPTSVAKAVLLASCPPLHYLTTPEEFICYLELIASSTRKDKHLYSVKQICASLGPTTRPITELDIRNDRERIEHLLGVQLDRVAKSTADVSTFAEPLVLPFTQSDVAGRSATHR